jgi:hypothetical protein
VPSCSDRNFRVNLGPNSRNLTFPLEVNSYLEGNIKKHCTLKRTEIENITFEMTNRAIRQPQCKCAYLLKIRIPELFVSMICLQHCRCYRVLDGKWCTNKTIILTGKCNDTVVAYFRYHPHIYRVTIKNINYSRQLMTIIPAKLFLNGS